MENAPLKKQDKAYKQFVLRTIDVYNTNGKKNLLYFCDAFYPNIDGVCVVLDNYAATLSKYYNVIVVVPKHKNLVSVQDNYLVIGVNSLWFNFVKYDLAVPDLDAFLKKALKRLRIDIIHSHSPFTLGRLAENLAKKRKVPLVMTSHSQYKQDFEKHVKSKGIVNILTNNIVKVFNGATEVWTMNDVTADILKSYGYNGNFYLLPNATHLQIPDNRQKLKEEFNSMYSLSNDIPVLMYLGRIIELKNVFFIAKALKVLDDRGMDFRMYFVGSGPDEKKLAALVKELGLEHKVKLCGRITDRGVQAKYFQRADLFLFPSLYDTSSLVQIEAALFQTPGVFLKDSVTAKTVTDKVNGYFSDNDVEAYADTIAEALSNRDELKRVSDGAFNDLYVSYDMLAERIHQRYEQLLQAYSK